MEKIVKYNITEQNDFRYACPHCKIIWECSPYILKTSANQDEDVKKKIYGYDVRCCHWEREGKTLNKGDRGCGKFASIITEKPLLVLVGRLNDKL